MRVWLDPDAPAIARHDGERRHRRRCRRRTSRSPRASSTSRRSTSPARSRSRCRRSAGWPIPSSSPISSSSRRANAVVRLKDVGRAELSGLDYSSNSYLNLDPAVAIAIFQTPGLERARHRPGHPQDHGGCVQAVSARAQIRHRLRPDPVHPAVGRRGDGDDPRGDPAGRSGGRAVPADLARRHHSAGRHSGLADRHLLPDGDVRLLAEQPVAVRPRARRRHRGR